MSPGEFVEKVRECVEKADARTIMIDSLNGFLQSMPGEQFLALHMHELLTYLNNRGVVTLMILAQMGMIGHGMQTPVDVSYLADNILLLRYFEAHGEVRQAISMIKKRSGPHEHSIRELRLGPERNSRRPAAQRFPGSSNRNSVLDGQNQRGREFQLTTDAPINDLRVLIFTPFGKDAALIEKVLTSCSIPVDVCAGPAALVAAICEDAGAAIITEEVLQSAAIGSIAEKLSAQPRWSDFPIIVLTGGGMSTASTESAERSRAPLGNVSLLERPLRPATLVSAVRTAFTARQRQFEIRDHLREREAAEQALRRAHDVLETQVEQRTAALRALIFTPDADPG